MPCSKSPIYVESQNVPSPTDTRTLPSNAERAAILPFVRGDGENAPPHLPALESFF